jgi:hypothetical protein
MSSKRSNIAVATGIATYAGQRLSTSLQARVIQICVEFLSTNSVYLDISSNFVRLLVSIRPPKVALRRDKKICLDLAPYLHTA